MEVSFLRSRASEKSGDAGVNHVERFRALMSFQPVDRLPRIEWATWWDKTIERWQGEGLPVGAGDAASYFGLDPYWQYWFRPFDTSVAEPPKPVAGGVSCMDDYEEIRPYLYHTSEAAFERLAAWAIAQDRGDAVVWITLEGFFWWPRSLLGIERHLYAFYDQPELLHKINSDLADHHLRILHRLSSICRPAFMTFAEDMSYNHGPMLSEKLFQEFLAPYYRRVVPALKEMGVVIIVDSDGDVTEMVPWLTSVGVDGVLPLERQAGVDASELRRRYPSLRMIGHFDKMVMTKGEEAMRAEFERLLPVMRSGGFIPSVDHQTPPGVSLEEYRCYLRLLEEYSKVGAGSACAG